MQTIIPTLSNRQILPQVQAASHQETMADFLSIFSGTTLRKYDFKLKPNQKQSTKAKCVVLPEVEVKPINPREFTKEIMDAEASLVNIKETMLSNMENKLESFSKENIEKLCGLIKEVLNEEEILLLVASKKIRFENELNQEVEYMKYFLVYLIIAFKLLNKGGSFVLRTYDHHIPFTCAMLFLLYKHFDQITIIKPLSSNLHSAERFVVATGFLSEGRSLKGLVDQLYGLLEAVSIAGKEGKEILSAMDLATFQNHPEFKTYVLETNSQIAEWRIHFLGNLLELIKHPNKELGGKDEVKDLCLKLWGVPVLKPADTKAKFAEKRFAEEKSEDEKDEFIVF
eukprot:TRINITY_DN2526_c0_g1_i1.p2 TRINITY_DN2526_c0_g1~~TRINITY_DN2526_c0_g1_i1.p2  ORF type:complete len:341 (-),score=44.44 TRINITY_DN2526_c0_g1_i1:458-1480(-)